MKDQISFKEDIKELNISKPIKIIELFDDLSDLDITYLDIELLQVIINFKWKEYTFKFFLK